MLLNFNVEQAIELVCMSCGDTSMTPKKGGTMFYACPNYNLQKTNATHRRCINRLSVNDYVKAVEHLRDKLSSADGIAEEINLTNYRWHTRTGIEYQVLSHFDNKIRLGVRNKRAVKYV